MVITLTDECIEALGKDNIIILSMNEKDKIFDIYRHTFPITWCGRVDWNNVKKKIMLNSSDEILPKLNLLKKYANMEVFIMWDEATLPVIKTTLNNVIRFIDDVTAVSFDTWLFSTDFKYIVELTHSDITVGLAPESYELKLIAEDGKKSSKTKDKAHKKIVSSTLY